MNNAELEKLTLAELRGLLDKVEHAIRAAIRAKKAASQPSAPPERPLIDLERERDAWLSGRR